ncbi:MAG: lamin tail domain-containing protein [Sphingobacteriaceae bacterium]|nr:lamin tail domain-containing protein [Sphingobacteriaceae bacterium]
MNWKPTPARPLYWLLFSVLLSACKTQDVFPTLTLVVSSANVRDDGGSTRIIVRLNGPVSSPLTVPLSFSGTAVLNQHYSLSANEITVNAGVDSGFITITTIASTDTSAKQIIVSLGDIQNVLIQSQNTALVNLVSATADRDGDGIPDIDDDCPDDPGPAENNGCPWLGLLINEVLYDPAADAAGDANGDGVRDPLADEFVELFNSNPALNISGYTLSDASMVRHTFPVGTIVPSNGVIVVFGGGNPTGSFGGAIVQTATEGQLNLNNAGDVLTLRNNQGNVVAVFDINGLSGNPDEAYTRNPDITGGFVRHSTIPAANGRLFSPGVKVNGTNF